MFTELHKETLTGNIYDYDISVFDTTIAPSPGHAIRKKKKSPEAVYWVYVAIKQHASDTVLVGFTVAHEGKIKIFNSLSEAIHGGRKFCLDTRQSRQ